MKAEDSSQMTEEQSLFTTRKTAAGNRYEEQPEERKKGLRKLTLKLRLTLLLFVIRTSWQILRRPMNII